MNRERRALGAPIVRAGLSSPMRLESGARLSRSARIGHDGISDRRSVEGHAEASGLVITGRIWIRGQSGTDPVIRQTDTHPSRLAGIKPRRRSLVPSSVTLPDIPVGQSEVGVVSVHNRSAATVTQAGGLNGLPAFSSRGQEEAGGRGRQDSVKRLRKPASTVGPMNGERSSAPGGCGNGRLPSLRADLGRSPVSSCPRLSSFVQRQAGEPGVTQRHSGLKRLPASVGGMTWGTW